MSANLDLVRSIFADWERGDFGSAEWADPEIEYVMADGPSPGSWTGRPGMAAGMGELVSAWQDYRVEADEYHELDGDRVLVRLRAYGRGKASGLELEQTVGDSGRGANVFHITGAVSGGSSSTSTTVAPSPTWASDPRPTRLENREALMTTTLGEE